MGLRLTVNVNLSRLKRFKENLDADLRLAANGPVRRAFQDWVTIYARFLTRRFFLFSLGAGTWKPLKPETLKRKKKRGLLPWILRATDTMFQMFAPQIAAKPGRLSEQIPFGVRVGFGGGMYMRYPDGPRVAEVAMYHQEGAGNLPVRKIIVPPDQPTIKEMRDVMQDAIMDLEKGAAA